MLISIVLKVIVVGVLLWLAETLIPMDDMVKKILRAVVIIALVLWLLVTFGLWDGNIRAQGVSELQPPQLTQEKFYAMLGQSQAQINLLNEFVGQLQAKIASMTKELEEAKAPKKDEKK